MIVTSTRQLSKAMRILQLIDLVMNGSNIWSVCCSEMTIWVEKGWTNFAPMSTSNRCARSSMDWSQHEWVFESFEIACVHLRRLVVGCRSNKKVFGQYLLLYDQEFECFGGGCWIGTKMLTNLHLCRSASHLITSIVALENRSWDFWLPSLSKKCSTVSDAFDLKWRYSKSKYSSCQWSIPQSNSLLMPLLTAFQTLTTSSVHYQVCPSSSREFFRGQCKQSTEVLIRREYVGRHWLSTKCNWE